MIVAGSSGYGLNELQSAQGDIERQLGGGILSSIQGGARVERDTYVSRGYRTSAKGVQTQNINGQFHITTDPYASSFFFGGQGGNYLSNWTQLNYDYAVSQLQPRLRRFGRHHIHGDGMDQRSDQCRLFQL